MGDELLTANEVRRWIGLSDYQLTQLVKSGEIPAVRLGRAKNSHLRFRREDLEAWYARNLVVQR
jgi:DNA binding domain, excisionase family